MTEPGPWTGLRGIVLDAVGTLIEPTPSVSEAYAQAARRQGVELSLAEVKSRFRRHFHSDEVDEARGPLATDEATERRRWRRIVDGCLPELPDPALAFDELWEHFADPGSWFVFPDVPRALSRLQEAGYRLCVASNFDARLRRVVAGLPELCDRLGPLVISSEVGYRKPHAEFYRAACTRLELPPEVVLCVGDDDRNDVQGPRAAGLRALKIDRDGARGLSPESLPDLEALAAFLTENRGMG